LGLTGFFDPATYMPVRSYLKVPPTHYDYDLLDRLYSLERLFSFAVVRHPVKRMISNYRWFIEKSTSAARLSKMGFSEYLEYIFEQYGLDENVVSGHIKPQTRFVGRKVSKVFKYEDGLESAVGEVLRHLGLKLKGEVRLPVANNTTVREVVPSKQELERIYGFYKEDFVAFDYQL
ncbi:sulfotransferase family 2 domain-containing protein, partial [Aestuariivirga sp.]|uniref:sulfotransferase family 2 domain-containing protein n=1 Tax=Aestuariivirga sp. TaxID=2650926 RepID=UPI00378453D6